MGSGGRMHRTISVSASQSEMQTQKSGWMKEDLLFGYGNGWAPSPQSKNMCYHYKPPQQDGAGFSLRAGPMHQAQPFIMPMTGPEKPAPTGITWIYSGLAFNSSMTKSATNTLQYLTIM